MRKRELSEEISTLEQIRSILTVSRLELNVQASNMELLSDDTLIEIANTLVLPKSTLKETKWDVNDFNKAEEALCGDLRVRIVILPPMTVAAYHYIGENPEEKVGNTVSRFVQQSKLYEKKPDARLFGWLLLLVA